MKHTHSNHRLHTRLRCTTDVVGEGRSELDLQDGHDSDQKPEYSRKGHDAPKHRREEGGSVLEDRLLLEDENKRKEQKRAVHVILMVIHSTQLYVVAQRPAVVPNTRNHLLRENASQGHKQGGTHAKKGTHEGKVHFSLTSDVEPEDDDAAADEDRNGRIDVQQEIGQHNIEHDR